MKTAVLLIVLSLGVLTFYTNCGKVGESAYSQSKSVEQGDPSRGSLVYAIDGTKPACLSCHGAYGTLVVGVDLRATPADQIRHVMTVSPPSGMPLYTAGDLTEQNIIDLIAYIQTL